MINASGYGEPSGDLILVADDSLTIVSMVSSRLERSGYNVLTTQDGSDALRLALERRPTLAILDVEMPGLDGFEVTRRLRADERTRGTPVILLTAHADEAYVAAGYAAGANDYIKKPFSPQELQIHVEALLGRR